MRMHSHVCVSERVCIRGVFVFAVCLSSNQQPSTIKTSDEQTYDHTMPTCVQVGGQNLAISPDQNAKLETLLTFDIVRLFSLGCLAWVQELGSTTSTFFMSYDRKCPKEIQ